MPTASEPAACGVCGPQSAGSFCGSGGLFLKSGACDFLYRRTLTFQEKTQSGYYGWPSRHHGAIDMAAGGRMPPFLLALYQVVHGRSGKVIWAGN